MDARKSLEDIVRGVTKMADGVADALGRATALDILDGIADLSRLTALSPEDRLAVAGAVGDAKRGLTDRAEDTVEVRWRESFEGAPERSTRIKRSRVRGVTFDIDGGAEGRSAAAEVARENYGSTKEWHGLPLGDGPHIEILSPSSWVGLYQVTTSRSRRQGNDLIEFGARKATRVNLDLKDDQADAVRRLLHPSDVMKTYDLISNEDGVIWSPLRFQTWREEIAGMSRLFDDGTLRGLGRMAKCRLSDRVGVLIERPMELVDDYPSADDVHRFGSETGFRLECCDWETTDGGTMPTLVSFVPFDRIAAAPRVSEALFRVLPHANLPTLS